MTSVPRWARGSAATIEETATEKMAADVAAERLKIAGTGHLPLDPGLARTELTQEQRTNRASRPRTRRWRTLEKIDGQIDALNRRHAAVLERVKAAEERLRAAPDHDTRAVATWLAAGERGDRPAPTIYDRERDRDAARLLADAVVVELDKVLDQRVRHVEARRAAMVADARRDVTQLLDKFAEIPALREELLAARETLLWIAAYPEPVDSFGFPTAVALGLREPVERTLHTKAKVEHAALLQALEEDATALAEAFSTEQKRRQGIDGPRTPLREAMWDGDPDNVAWKKAELERARELDRWAADPLRLANEARDLRPDPPDLTPRPNRA
jgi:hypothetical protein